MEHSDSKLCTIALSSGGTAATPSPELTLFSYEILGLVGRGGAAPHDLLRMAQRDRLLAWAGESQYYTEPKRLADLGYLAARREPGKTRERTVYNLTDKGLRALSEWAQTPASLTPLKSEALIRLLIGDLVGDEATRQSIGQLREEITDIEARLDDAESRASQLPHRERNLKLVFSFLRGYLDLHQELTKRVEQDLAGSPKRARAKRTHSS
jgi:DNA-binding PadR family transcriptional regulator